MAWTLALLALNSYQVAYSQDAKMYSMLWLLATASSGCFLNALSGRPGRKWWLAGYGIATACLPLTSYVGIVPVLIQGIYGLLCWCESGDGHCRCSTPPPSRWRR